MTRKRNWLSSSVAEMRVSAIKEMAMRSTKVPGAVSLTWGLPSFRTPEHIRRAVAGALERDTEIGKYALPDGLPQLREAAVRRHFVATGMEVNPDQNVLITAGNMQGLNALFHTVIDPRDEIIVTDPGFASHFQQIRLCGGQPVPWQLDESRNWRLDVDALPALITDKTKAIVLVSPSNPTGKIFPEQELRKVGEIAAAHNVLIFLDDPYRHFTYENRDAYFNLASVPELFDHIAYLFTFSKSYAMSGWRLGYMILPERLKQEVLKVHDATIICAPRISQVAGLAALTQKPVHLEEFEQILARRRTLICERLNRVEHVFQYTKPEGAYYIFPRIVTDHPDSVEFSIRLLETAKVAVTPGSAFGPSGEHHVRMAYCVSEDTIEKAFDRIEKHFSR